MPLKMILEIGRGKVKGIPDRGSAWGKVWWQNGQGDSTELKEGKSNTWKAVR